jgi:hypothetical protein
MIMETFQAEVYSWILLRVATKVYYEIPLEYFIVTIQLKY